MTLIQTRGPRFDFHCETVPARPPSERILALTASTLKSIHTLDKPKLTVELRKI